MREIDLGTFVDEEGGVDDESNGELEQILRVCIEINVCGTLTSQSWYNRAQP